MNLLFRLMPLCVSVLLLGCHAHDPAVEALEARALALHDSILVVEKQVRAQVEHLEGADTASLSEFALRDSLEALTADLATWTEALVEPEGEHDHDHGHDHSHEPALEVTPEQMVELQHALLEGIQVLHTRTTALAERLQSDSE